MDLALTLEMIGPYAVLHCDGRIVFGPNSEQFSKRCNDLLERHSVIGLDLSGVTALDSGGVGSLVHLLTTARRRGQDIVLIAPSPRAARVLEITRLASVFRQYGSMQQFAAPLSQAVGA